MVSHQGQPSPSGVGATRADLLVIGDTPSCPSGLDVLAEDQAIKVLQAVAVSGNAGPAAQASDAVAIAAPSHVLPSEIHPALTADRLRVCARLLANARRDAVRMASPEMGDDSWSIGCRAYAFGKQRLQRTAEARTYNWLNVLDQSHHFVFLIENVPVRFFRGAADEPTSRTLRRQVIEAEQLSLVLGKERAEGLVFRLALEAEASGDVERVVFLALRGEEGQVECLWPVPLSDPKEQIAAPEQLRLLEEEADVRIVRSPRRRA